MPEYRRLFVPGACYFFTVVTYKRSPWLSEDLSRRLLRQAILHVRTKHPFRIEAWVLLPDHLHCLWRLPKGDSDFSTRWNLIKGWVTTHLPHNLQVCNPSNSHRKRREQAVWQRRFWEHRIRDDDDFRHHCDYIHYNPVKHGLCSAPKFWPFSSFHRFVKEGKYDLNWGSQIMPEGIDGISGKMGE
ncbi:MAG: transposase [Acidobacteria bacterium]|nr:MAG: transposase [Acidobacteriota bacterium]